MSQPTPTQELVAKDLHGYEWRFKHIFRGKIDEKFLLKSLRFYFLFGYLLNDFPLNLFLLFVQVSRAGTFLPLDGVLL